MIKRFFKWVAFCFMQSVRFCFSKPNPQENIIQFIFRHFILTDSSGTPSYTVTILVYIMTLFGIVTMTEVKVSLSTVTTFDPQGNILSSSLKGISSEYLFILAPLVGLIVFFFKSRGDRTAQNCKNYVPITEDDKPETSGGATDNPGIPEQQPTVSEPCATTNQVEEKPESKKESFFASIISKVASILNKFIAK